MIMLAKRYESVYFVNSLQMLTVLSDSKNYSNMAFEDDMNFTSRPHDH